MGLALDVGVVLRDGRMMPGECDRILLLSKVIGREMWIATYDEGGPVFAIQVSFLEEHFEAVNG